MSTYVTEPLAERVLPPAPNFRKLADRRPGTDSVTHVDPTTGRPSLAPLLGVVMTTQEDARQAVEQYPDAITIPHDYVDREHWIDRVNPSYVTRAAGPASNPMAQVHTFPHAEKLVFHLLDGDVTYRVTHQPDKYDDVTGEVADRGGDPNTHCDWFYVAELEG